MRLPVCLSALLATLVLFSCQPELEDPSPAPDPDPADTLGMVLWKTVFLDTTLPSGLDTLVIELFEYDAAKRLTKHTIYGREDTAHSPAYSSLQVYRYFYPGSDTLPNKILYSSDNAAAPEPVQERDTTYYLFQNGYCVYDSTSGRVEQPSWQDSHISVHTYAVAGNIVNVREKFDHPQDPSIPPDITDYVYTLTKSNGNIVHQQMTASGFSNGISDEMYVYDDKPNVYYRHFVSTRIPIFLWNDVPTGNQKNNLVEVIDGSWHTYFTYTYRSDGYPLILRMRQEHPGDPTAHYKGIFYYKN